MNENSEVVSNSHITSGQQNVCAYSVKQFCGLHGISVAHFYNLKADNLAPDSFMAGDRRLIDVDAARRWRKKMEEKTAQDSAEKHSPQVAA
jgi:hypothetical protein